MHLNDNSPASFDPFHPDGLLFEDNPGLFVDLDATPIVFTVRGIALFRERFKRVGVNLSFVTTRDAFDAAHKRWLAVERVLLTEHIAKQARNATPLSDAALLAAIWEGDLDTAEGIANKRDRIAGSGLQVVRAT